MARHYTAEECARKSDQYWEMAGLARVDGDKADELIQTNKAKMWDNRARLGGYTDEGELNCNLNGN